MLFSVIVANYNNGAYLTELIHSIQKQTYTNWQLVIADDCSTDDSRQIMEQYSGNENIILLFHKTNKGAAATFKTAVDAANGEIIGMLGADDALVPQAIERMVQSHKQHPEASLICSNLYECDGHLTVLSIWDKYKAPQSHGSLIVNPSLGSFATFKKTCYLKTEGFDPAFKKALDHDIYLKLEEQGQVFYHDEPLYLYRANPIGISQNTNWFEATIYSLQARRNAYKRRLNRTDIISLSETEYRQLLKLQYDRLALLNRTKKQYLDFLRYWFLSRIS